MATVIETSPDTPLDHFHPTIRRWFSEAFDAPTPAQTEAWPPIAERDGLEYHLPAVGVRSGDTPSSERYKLNRKPPDILITTPESLYLILTSRARDILRTTETVIVDEIHSMVGTKRGSHLFLSLERLESLRRTDDPERKPMQRIGLSATQRPLEEVARLLGGAEATSDPEQSPRSRPVEIIEAGRKKQLDLQIEVPVEDMARLGDPEIQPGPAAADRLRTIQNSAEETEEEVYVLAATDPANPYGAALRWPQSEEVPSRPQRVAGARVIIRRGSLIGYLGRTGQQLLTFLPETEPEQSESRQALIRTLAGMAEPGHPVYLAKVDSVHPSESDLSEALLSAGFTATSRGFLNRGGNDK